MQTVFTCSRDGRTSCLYSYDNSLHSRGKKKERKAEVRPYSAQKEYKFIIIIKPYCILKIKKRMIFFFFVFITTLRLLFCFFFLKNCSGWWLEREEGGCLLYFFFFLCG
eukprot:TRINITY_DN2448_c0_g2_i1.p1 TRINITY_DN2448_c0_g2~~TRINITY_DN2448_c0_g2_i1.p1  ORF type:complete len:109 (-),score=1.91 TRINITY_DN2448_c0_g2_i1:152-478(-)